MRIELQKLLAKKVIREGEYPNIKYIAGCDVSFEKNSSYGFAVVTVLGYPDLNVVEVSTNVGKTTMPYTGLLSFREAPLLIDAFVN
jgi:deoxyribonuclease V